MKFQLSNKQKIALNTLDDKSCYIEMRESVAVGYSEFEFLPIKRKHRILTIVSELREYFIKDIHAISTKKCFVTNKTDVL